MPDAAQKKAYIFIVFCLFLIPHYSQSIKYTFESNEDTSEWGICAFEETDSGTKNTALKLNPCQSKTILLKPVQEECAGKVRFRWNNHGTNPSIFELKFFVDNDSKIENDRINEWTPTEKFQMSNNSTHNLTWNYGLKDNWKKMNKKLWNSSCWIDDVELEGLEFETPIPKIKNVSIKPENGSLKDTYTYFVYIKGMDENCFNSIRLEASDDSGMRRLKIDPIRYNNSCCIFEVNNFSSMGDFLGSIKYDIIFKNRSLKHGKGPKIDIDWTKLIGEKQPDGTYTYNISVRSIYCPMDITFYYREAGAKKKAGSYSYNSCPRWKSFEWIGYPKYDDFWVVNEYEGS